MACFAGAAGVDEGGAAVLSWANATAAAARTSVAAPRVTTRVRFMCVSFEGVRYRSTCPPYAERWESHPQVLRHAGSSDVTRLCRAVPGHDRAGTCDS